MAIVRTALVVSAAMLIVAAPTSAQFERVGEVTTAQGHVMLTRAAAAPTPLRFREPVLLRDRINTGERSLARILFGDRALVTVTERSVVTVTDTPDASVIEMSGPGRLALAVAHDRMRRGESIQIRTPHAVAAVRGTVVVAEVLPGPDGRLFTRFTVLRGIVDVTRTDGTPVLTTTSPLALGMRESADITGTGPASVTVLSEAAATALASTFKVAPAPVPVAATAPTDQQMKDALADAARFKKTHGDESDGRRHGEASDVRRGGDGGTHATTDSRPGFGDGDRSDGMRPDRGPTFDGIRPDRGPTADGLRPDRGPIAASDPPRGAGPADRPRPLSMPELLRPVTLPDMSRAGSRGPDIGPRDAGARDTGKLDRLKK